jgi:hypothetical protein
MFFEKKEEVIIDGNKYVLSMGAMNDVFSCKEAICEVFNYLDPERMENECKDDNYKAWEKELKRLLKEWDKCYVKHQKSFYPELVVIHQAAMKPLMDLVISNLNLHQLEMMIKAKKEVPDFRLCALEEEFCKFMTGVCQIFKDYGNMQEYFNIK